MMTQLISGQIDNWSFVLIKMSHDPLILKNANKKDYVKINLSKMAF
jgi:hypothetical protein